MTKPTNLVIPRLSDVMRETADLVKRSGHSCTEITKVRLADDGHVAGVELGQDDDGMARVVLNFGL